MRKISNFCGIFATVFVTTTIVLLASCSQDDDNYESDMYTMAEMGTRLLRVEPGSPHFRGGNKNVLIVCEGLHLTYEVSWGSGYWYELQPDLTFVNCDNLSGYPFYVDTLVYPIDPDSMIHHIYTNSALYNVEYVRYDNAAGLTCHMTEIKNDAFDIYVKRAVKRVREDGSYIYVYGPEERRPVKFSVDISEYKDN